MNTDCSICLEVLEGVHNRLTTDCGHCFHTNCFLQNVSHNGFACPNCRNQLVEEPNDESDDEDDYDEDDYDEDVYDEDVYDEEDYDEEDYDEDDYDEDDYDDDEYDEVTCLVGLLVEEAPQIGDRVLLHRQPLHEVLVVHPHAQPTHHHHHHHMIIINII